VCPLCGDHLLSAGQPPQSPEQWELGLVSQAGGLLPVQTLRATGLDRGLPAALQRWRAPRAVHDPGKVIADLAVAVALGGDCLPARTGISRRTARDARSLPLSVVRR